MHNEVEDSGQREQFEDGAVRDTRTGKGRYDLLPIHAIHRLARHYENGAVKYKDDNNWRKGMPMTRVMDSLLRHAFQFLGGARDEDHLAAIVWNACAIMEMEEMINSGTMSEKWSDMPDHYGKLSDPPKQPATRDPGPTKQLLNEANVLKEKLAPNVDLSK